MKNAGLFFKISLILTAALLLLSCNALERNTQSASLLVLVNLLGRDMEDNEVNYLESDVLIEDPDTGATTYTADPAVATFRVTLLNPNTKVASSIYNAVQLTRYVVTYSQPNGNNVEGRDVPYSFEGSMSTLVTVGTNVDVAFVIVRDVAKLEPPLIDLRDGVNTLQVRAKVDFYGKDIAGYSVKTTGYLTIFFANWVNESTAPPPPASKVKTNHG